MSHLKRDASFHLQALRGERFFSAASPSESGAGESGTSNSGSESGSESPNQSSSGGTGESGVLAQQVEDLQKTVADLNRANRNKSEENDRVRGRFDDLVSRLGGEDAIESLLEIRSQQQTAEEERMRKEGEWDALERQLRDTLSKKDEEILGLRSSIERGNVRTALSVAGDLPEIDVVSHEQIDKMFGSDFQEKDGNVMHKSIRNQDTGELASAEYFLAQIKKAGSHPNLFNAAVTPGSGSPGGDKTTTEGVVRIKMVNGSIPADEQKRYEKAKEDGRNIEFDHVRE